VRGLFITIEGIDGCGKTTQARLLVEWLREQGYEVRATREPGGTPAGSKIRELVLSNDHSPPPAAELFLYLADRAIHVAEVVRPALAAGEVVVCERYTDSTLAYQGYGRGLDLELLRRLNGLATEGLKPDLTVVLDLAPEQARLDAGRLDRLESEGLEFLGRVAEGFRELARQGPERIKLADGAGDVETVRRDIARLVRDFLERRHLSG
jgi:dTMP kinase